MREQFAVAVIVFTFAVLVMLNCSGCITVDVTNDSTTTKETQEKGLINK